MILGLRRDAAFRVPKVCPKTERQHLVRAVDDDLSTARGPLRRTARAYANDWADFEAFCGQHAPKQFSFSLRRLASP
jgi:hypothetical protein